METDSTNNQQEPHNPLEERRKIKDRRSHHDRRDEVRYEPCRRKNKGRREGDGDPWKESLEFE